MKYTFAALLLATTFATPVAAAEIAANSKIDAVTVYPQGAEVTRVARVDIVAGDHTLVLDDLPGSIDPQSIRVEGSAGAAVRIGSVDSRIVHVLDDAARAGERKALEERIEVLRDEAAGLDQLIRAAGVQRELIQDLARRPFTTKRPPDTELQVDSAELGNLFDLVAGRLQRLDEKVLAARIRTRKINQEIAEAQTRLAELAPRQEMKAVVSVHLSSPAATSGTFRVRYRINGARWRPFYDARLSLPEGGGEPVLELVRRAEIVQRTSEDWRDVALTLSTSRPLGATAAPQLPPLALGFGPVWSEKLANKREAFADEPAMTEGAGIRADAPEEARKEDDNMQVQQQQAETTVAGFQALYKIPGRVSIDNRGTARKVEISASQVEASLSAHAVPMLDPNAYLTASFTLDGDTPLLPGRVLVFRDNVYMGAGSLPLLSPGEEHALGFGADDRIKVTRSEVHSETSESGIISTDLVQENSWLIEVENLHAREMPVKVFERMPFSTHEDITVTMLAGSTLPSERDVDNKRGVVAWDLELDEGEKQAITFGYRVTSPKDKPVRLGMR